mgnify:FL=1
MEIRKAAFNRNDSMTVKLAFGRLRCHVLRVFIISGHREGVHVLTTSVSLHVCCVLNLSSNLLHVQTKQLFEPIFGSNNTPGTIISFIEFVKLLFKKTNNYRILEGLTLKHFGVRLEAAPLEKWKNFIFSSNKI